MGPDLVLCKQARMAYRVNASGWLVKPQVSGLLQCQTKSLIWCWIIENNSEIFLYTKNLFWKKKKHFFSWNELISICKKIFFIQQTMDLGRKGSMWIYLSLALSWFANANLAAFSWSLANLFSNFETFLRVGLMNFPFMSLTDMCNSLICKSLKMTSRWR